MALTRGRCSLKGCPALPRWVRWGKKGARRAHCWSESSYRCMGGLQRKTAQLASRVYLYVTPLKNCQTEPSLSRGPARLIREHPDAAKDGIALGHAGDPASAPSPVPAGGRPAACG